MKKIIVTVCVFIMYIQWVTALSVDGVTITPWKFIEKNRLVAEWNYDSEKEELSIIVKATNKAHDGKIYEINMQILWSDCRIPFIYDQATGYYSGECVYSETLENVSVLRDLTIEIYQHHIASFRIREQKLMPLNLTLDWEHQLIDWDNLYIDLLTTGGIEVWDTSQLDFFLRLEEIAHYPLEDYHVDVKIFTPNFTIEEEDVIFEIDSENKEYSAIVSKEFKILLERHDTYGEHTGYHTDIRVYKLKDGKKPDRSKRVSPLIVVHDFETIDEVRTFYESNERPKKEVITANKSQNLVSAMKLQTKVEKNINDDIEIKLQNNNEKSIEENIEIQEDVAKDDTIEDIEVEIIKEAEDKEKEESIVEKDDVEAGKKIHPLLQSRVRSFLLKLENKLLWNTERFQKQLRELKKSLEEYALKSPERKEIIEDIIYLIDEKIEG